MAGDPFNELVDVDHHHRTDEENLRGSGFTGSDGIRQCHSLHKR